MEGQQSKSRKGKVYLVGAGPGAPGLITLRGTECLAEARGVDADAVVDTDVEYVMWILIRMKLAGDPARRRQCRHTLASGQGSAGECACA